MDGKISYGSCALPRSGVAFSLPFRGGGPRATGGWGLRRTAHSPRWAPCPVPGGPGICRSVGRQRWRQLLRSLVCITEDIACFVSYYAFRGAGVNPCVSIHLDRTGRFNLRHPECCFTTSGMSGGRLFYDNWNARGLFYDKWNFYDRWNETRRGNALAARCMSVSSETLPSGRSC